MQCKNYSILEITGQGWVFLFQKKKDKRIFGCVLPHYFPIKSSIAIFSLNNKSSRLCNDKTHPYSEKNKRGWFLFKGIGGNNNI